MSEHLPEEVRRGLDLARRKARQGSKRLCIHADDEVYKVLRLWGEGFALAVGEAPWLRGYVDLYDGSRHLSQCLVVTSRDTEDERIYEFKWNTPVLDAPPVDFVLAGPRTAGHLPAPH